MKKKIKLAIYATFFLVSIYIVLFLFFVPLESTAWGPSGESYDLNITVEVMPEDLKNKEFYMLEFTPKAPIEYTDTLNIEGQIIEKQIKSSEKLSRPVNKAGKYNLKVRALYTVVVNKYLFRKQEIIITLLHLYLS